MKSKNSIFRSLKDNNEGGVLIMAAFFIVVLFALGGAGVDFGRAYLIKMKSQQASDAAALAAANVAKQNPTKDDREATAQMYYNLNFPATYLGVARPPMKFTPGDVSLSVENKTAMNTNFIRTMGSQFDTLNVSTQSKVNIASGDPKYDVILVLDSSDSMDWTFDGTMCDSSNKPPADEDDACNDGTDEENTDTNYCYNPDNNYYSCGTASRLAGLRAAANTMADELLAPVVLGNNRIALVNWNHALRTKMDFANNIAAVKKYITDMRAVGGTDSTKGLEEAKKIAANFRTDAVHAVVLLTDGLNTGTSTPSKNVPAKHDPAIDAASIALCNEFKSQDPPTVVYTIAVGDIVKKDESGNFTEDGQKVNDFMSKCASGAPASNLNQFYFITSSDSGQLNTVFKTIADSVQKLRITD